MTIICSHCGGKRIVSDCRAHLGHCSRECYEESLKLDAKQIRRMARMGLNRREAAATLEIPYPTFYRKLRRQGLNGAFPTLSKTVAKTAPNNIFFA